MKNFLTSYFIILSFAMLFIFIDCGAGTDDTIAKISTSPTFCYDGLYSNPVFSMNRNGDSLIVFNKCIEDEKKYSTYYSIFDINGNRKVPNTFIDTGNNFQIYDKYFLYSTLNFLKITLFTEYQPDKNEYLGILYSSNGSILQNPYIISTNQNSIEKVILSPDNNIFVFYMHDSNLYGTVYSSNGSILVDETVVLTIETDENLYDYTLAINKNKKLGLLFSKLKEIDNDYSYSLSCKYLDETLTTTGYVYPLEISSTNQIANLSISLDGTGNGYLSYSIDTDSGWKVYAESVDTIPEYERFNMSISQNENPLLSKILASDDGTFALFYRNKFDQVIAAIYDSSGNIIKSSFVIYERNENFRQNSIYMDKDGNFVLINSESNNGIFLKFYDKNGNFITEREVT